MEKITAINGEILTWARQECNLTIDQIATKMKQNENTISDWEVGRDFPTYHQLDKLAGYLQKPIAIFFFPEPPKINNIKASLRTLPNYVYDNLSSNIIQLMNEARVKQLNLYELHDNKNPSKIQIAKLKCQLDVEKDAQVLRKILGVSIEEQKQIKNSKLAFEMWRDKFALCGIYVFKSAFRNDAVSGFCIYDDIFPVIYINNSVAASRQIFTLFHEYYHILSKTSGIDLKDDSYIGDLEGKSKNIEIACNSFSGEFLVPKLDFNREIRAKDINEINEITIAKMANRYSVSREVIMRKLLDKNIISEDYYLEKKAQFDEEAIKSKGRNNGGNYYYTQIAYLGHRYLQIAYDRYRTNKIDRFKLAEYLNIKAGNLSKLETAWVGGIK